MTELIPAVLHAALTLGVVLSAPRASRTPRWIGGVAWISVCVGGAWASRSLAGAAFGWACALAPFLTDRFGPSVGWRGAASLLFFPAQSGLASTFEKGPLLPLSLLLNGHLGALVAARLLDALPPAAVADARSWIVAGALLGAAWSVVQAYGEAQPRRALARLMAGQGAIIFAGLACGNASGQAGALALWQTAAVASTMLVCVYAGLEARVGRDALDRPGFLGLASNAPRLAVFFAVAAFALGDLPLTLGFPAAELLLLGVMDVGPVGLLLPAVAAVNAFVVLRLYARLFWGRSGQEILGMPDALPRERWMLCAGMLYLVFGGLYPSALLP